MNVSQTGIMNVPHLQECHPTLVPDHHQHPKMQVPHQLSPQPLLPSPTILFHPDLKDHHQPGEVAPEVEVVEGLGVVKVQAEVVPDDHFLGLGQA